MPFRLNGKEFSIENLTIFPETIRDDELREAVLSVPAEERFACLQAVNAKVRKSPHSAGDWNVIRYDFEIKDRKIRFIGGFVSGMKVL